MNGAKMRLIAVLTLLSFLVVSAPPQALAQGQIVPLNELHNKLGAKADARAENLNTIDRVLSLPAAQEAMAKAKVDPGQARTAIAQLDDNELSRLADQARAAEADLQGGLLIGILALIGLIVVIIVIIAIVT
jgi:CHASE3 domain sensor protein